MVYGGFRIRDSMEIEQILEYQDIVRFTRAERIQSCGLVERMDYRRMPKRLLKVEPQCQRGEEDHGKNCPK